MTHSQPPAETNGVKRQAPRSHQSIEDKDPRQRDPPKRYCMYANQIATIRPINMLQKIIILLASLAMAPVSQAFVLPRRLPSHLPSVGLQASTHHSPELSPIDEMCMENVAEFCLHEQCDVEEYGALINQLQDQRDYVLNHVAKVETLLRHLKDANHPEYDPEEVSELFDKIKKTLAEA